MHCAHIVCPHFFVKKRVKRGDTALMMTEIPGRKHEEKPPVHDRYFDPIRAQDFMYTAYISYIPSLPSRMSFCLPIPE